MAGSRNFSRNFLRNILIYPNSGVCQKFWYGIWKCLHSKDLLLECSTFRIRRRSFSLNTKMVLRHHNMLHCCLLTIDNNISAFMRQIRIQKSDKTIAKQPQQSGKMTDKRKNVENREPKNGEAKRNRERRRERNIWLRYISRYVGKLQCARICCAPAPAAQSCVSVSGDNFPLLYA